MRIGGIALVVAYLTGIAWWIFVEIERKNDDYFQYGDNNFINQSQPSKFFEYDVPDS